MTDHAPLSYAEAFSRELVAGDVALVFTERGVLAVFSNGDRVEMHNDHAANLHTAHQHVAVRVAKFLEQDYSRLLMESAHALFDLQTDGLTTAPGSESAQ